jgi:hypothetical protein
MPTAKSGRDAVTVSAVFTALAGIIVLTRLYTRYFIVKHFPLEEYLVAFSMVWIRSTLFYGPGRMTDL